MVARIFFCYAHEDEMLLNKLKIHLRTLERQHEIEMWHDRDISAGKVWSREIETQLEAAQIILLLISPDFMASDYCYGVEMKRALERNERGETRVIPIILRHVHWQETSLGQLQALPRDGRPINDASYWQNVDEALVDVVKGIQKVVMELKVSPPLDAQFSQQREALLDTLLSTYMDDTSRRPSEAQILTRSLVVLLGSTAGLVGLELMRQMLSLNPRDRRRVALIYIDMSDAPGPLLAFRKQHQNAFYEFPLRITVPSGISNVVRVPQSDEEVNGLQEGAPGNLRLKEQHTFIRDKVPQYFVDGAGGIRNNGHVAACFYYQNICDVLDLALKTISHHDLLLQDDVSVSSEIHVNIVSFLGSGAGSGMLPDVMVMVRDLLAAYQFAPRINIFCMLPGPVRGVNTSGLQWRKAKAAACLLELIVFSEAAVGETTGLYKKYMRDKVQSLSKGTVANEVYLVGHGSMEDPDEIARVVGLDLFQRITDASGVGFLERSTWMDRRVLHVPDDQGLPRMFSTSCSLELCFPAQEIASAFARVSASRFLSMLLTHLPTKTFVTEADKHEWRSKWDHTVDFGGTGDQNSITLTQFQQRDFKDASQLRLDGLWLECERRERELESRIKEILQHQLGEEKRRILQASLSQRIEDIVKIGLGLRIQNLQRLEQEYSVALEDLLQTEKPKVPSRPIDLEQQLMNQQSRPGVFRRISHDYTGDVCEAYNQRAQMYAAAIRRRLLKQMLQELIDETQPKVQESFVARNKFFEVVGAYARRYEEEGLTSRAWHGWLEYPSSHQRHVLDLQALRTQDGQNTAMERLYYSSTKGDVSAEDPGSYSSFTDSCAAFLEQRLSSSKAEEEQWNRSVEKERAAIFADYVVDFFHDYYVECFQNLNLLEILDTAAYTPQKNQSHVEQIVGNLMEHLRSLVLPITALEIDVMPEYLGQLAVSLLVGVHWRNRNQKAIIDRVLNMLSSAVPQREKLMLDQAIDPHRFQISYGEHGIGLGMLRDFCTDHDNAMEAYLDYQKKWEAATGKGSLMPLHSSGEAEHLVWSPTALGNDAPLPYRILRKEK